MRRPVLITGGAGFIGSNLADRFLGQGVPVTIYDNLSREGAIENVRWLQQLHGGKLKLIQADVRDRRSLAEAVTNASRIFHFAAQVAVTTSLLDARTDFEVNVLGTFNLLEALRGLKTPPPLLYTSTNKVYGSLEDIALQKKDMRYEVIEANNHRHGIGEARPLAFHTPYGCSKGAADQYVLDYARSFHGQAAVFRMSCIYGPRQFGTEDQGWVAHFLIRAIQDEPLTVYGDGFQVRDILFVDDLVDALQLAMERIAELSGQPFNIGGGPQRTISLIELLSLIEVQLGRRPRVRFEQSRSGDQKYYVSDSGRFRELTGWAPRVGVIEGIQMLGEWLEERCHPCQIVAAV